ncbi:MAG: hypothetical protein KGL46_14220 [Hyphomicrobiales bacterium]|nr:hypothetical protein [Hyphomicrobiales bacterium]
MCVSHWFAPKPNYAAQALELQQIQAAQQAQQQAQAAIAQSNMDTESSRLAAEAQMRKAALAQGFGATIKGGAADSGGSVVYKTLFGA